MLGSRQQSASVETIAYSRAASHLVVQNLNETKDAEGDSSCSGEAYLHFWHSFSAGGLEKHRHGNLDGIDMDQIRSGKDLLDWHVKTLENPATRYHVLPTCDTCGNPLQPGAEHTKTRIRSVDKKKRKRQPKKSRVAKKEKNDDDNPPILWQLAPLHPTHVKNALVVGCRLCGYQTQIPGLPRKEKEQPPVDKVATRTSGSVAAAKHTKPAVVRTELPTRDFIPLGSDKKKKKRKHSKPKSSQLHDFLNSLND
ncbi:expressed unknown protein [Seminavis robusta]|uniref:Uncharacterized protein n=1 Tax=Seminavis robusta TaxID=568900 RepID=A0A9N8HV42_9STRA|nr:expressed unknown protein [Seminavis robusta]|eukprot:Sro1925_g305810.1 n/a (253) ;mRNA; f:12937-13695